jgi:perosamine synthetase
MYNYGMHYIDNEDKTSVFNVIDNDSFLTCGEQVSLFEKEVCEYVGCSYACAVNSCTSALHLACLSLNISKNDEIIIPAISFAASSNCVLYCGGTPVFCDINKDTMNIDINKIESLITKKTKAIICVDFAGQVCDYDKLITLKQKYNLHIIEDAAHSIGAKYNDKYVGNISDLTTFSFHPVKNMTTGEGGMITTNNKELYKKCKLLRSHGLTRDFEERDTICSHDYDITCLGYNYRISDILCALGRSQLKKLSQFIKNRSHLVKYYDEKIKTSELSKYISPLKQELGSGHHIYIIKINKIYENILLRNVLYNRLHENGIKVNVHYKPIYLFSLYKKLGYKEGLCPIAEDVYQRIITLPLYYKLECSDIDIIINKLEMIIKNVIIINNLLLRLKQIDEPLFKYMYNEYLNGTDYCIHYLEDLIDARGESIALRNK